MKYIKGFDGLRAISILLVIVSHLGFTHSLFDDKVKNFFLSGGAGVNIFFTISGFLITSLLLAEFKKNSRIDLKKFFIRRFLRLLPPLLPFYAVLIVLMWFNIVDPAYKGIIVSIFYAYNFVPFAEGFFSKELSHMWSLSLEEQFYIYWAFGFRFWSRKLLILSAVILLIFSVVAYFLFVDFDLIFNGRIYHLDEIFFLNKWTIPAISSIMIGSLIAYLNQIRYQPIQELAKGIFFLLSGLIVLACPFYMPDVLEPLVSLFHAIGVGIILLWFSHNQNSVIVQAMELKLLKYIGVVSYGLYIWQGLFVRNGPDDNPVYLIHEAPYNVILTFIIAIASYELFEKRILRFKKKFRA